MEEKPYSYWYSRYSLRLGLDVDPYGRVPAGKGLERVDVPLSEGWTWEGGLEYGLEDIELSRPPLHEDCHDPKWRRLRVFNLFNIRSLAAVTPEDEKWLEGGTVVDAVVRLWVKEGGTYHWDRLHGRGRCYKGPFKDPYLSLQARRVVSVKRDDGEVLVFSGAWFSEDGIADRVECRLNEQPDFDCIRYTYAYMGEGDWKVSSCYCDSEPLGAHDLDDCDMDDLDGGGWGFDPF